MKHRAKSKDGARLPRWVPRGTAAQIVMNVIMLFVYLGMLGIILSTVFWERYRLFFVYWCMAQAFLIAPLIELSSYEDITEDERRKNAGR